MPKLAEVAIAVHDDETGQDEVRVFVFGLEGQLTPFQLTLLAWNPQGPPVNSPSISGQVTCVWNGDLTGLFAGNNAQDLIVATDNTDQTQHNLFLFQNNTVAGSSTGLNYTCVGAYFLDGRPYADDVIIDIEGVDADHDGRPELAVAFDSDGQGIVHIYDILESGRLGGWLVEYSLNFTVGIYDMAAGDFQFDNPVPYPDDLVILTDPTGVYPGLDTIHFYASLGGIYKHVTSMEMAGIQPVTAQVGHLFFFVPGIQSPYHPDFIFGSADGKVRFYYNNWGRSDIPDGPDEAPTMYVAFQPDLPGALVDLRTADIVAPSDFQDVIAAVQPEEPGVNNVYLFRFAPGPSVSAHQSTVRGTVACQAAVGMINDDFTPDLLVGDCQWQTTDVYLQDSVLTRFDEASAATVFHPGEVKHIEVLINQGDRSFR